MSVSIFSSTFTESTIKAFTEQKFSGIWVNVGYGFSFIKAARSKVSLPTSFEWSGLLLEIRLS